MEKILDIIDSIANEKGLRVADVTTALEKALVNTAKKSINPDIEYDAVIDKETKSAKIFQIIKVVDDNNIALDDDDGSVMSLSEAKELDEDVEVEDELRIEYSLDNLGRTAVATLYKEIEFHIQRLIEDDLYGRYQELIGQSVSGPVVHVDNLDNTYIEINEVRAILPKKNRIKGEIFRVGDTVKAMLRRVQIDQRSGMIIELSRTAPKFLNSLLSSEVPEIQDGLVVIENSARIPGERAKVSLSSDSSRIDPIGATVGVRGVRINAVSAEILNESIDCIEYSPIPELYISRTMSPAMVSSVKIEGTKAIVHLPADQKSKAIGRSGINIRLASMLTGYEIELVEDKSSLSASIENKDGTIKEEMPKQNMNDALSALFKD